MSDQSGPTSLHEAAEELRLETRDNHRAYRSLIEELEAVDWYAQRVDAAGDNELKAVLEHNGNEEKEHAAMVLEWLRRRDPVLDRHLRTYLFSDGSIVAREEAVENEDRGGGDGAALDLGIGTLRAKSS